MRFRSEQHLRRQGDIRAVREKGRRLDCRAFTLWWKPRDEITAANRGGSASKAEATGARVCVIASTAAVGAATRRNRAKRRLREVFRHHQANVPPGCDLLLIARAAVIDWPVAELERKFAEACWQISPAPETKKE